MSRLIFLRKTKTACEKHHGFDEMECVDEYFEEGLFHDWHVEVWRCPKCGWRLTTRRKTDKIMEDFWSKTENARPFSDHPHMFQAWSLWILFLTLFAVA